MTGKAARAGAPGTKLSHSMAARTLSMWVLPERGVGEGERSPRDELQCAVATGTDSQHVRNAVGGHDGRPAKLVVGCVDRPAEQFVERPTAS